MNYIRLSLLVLLITFFFKANSQIPKEDIHFGKKGKEELYEIIESFDGGIWGIGQTQSITRDGGKDVWIIKIDAEGKQTKSNRIGGYGDYKGTSLAENRDGKLMIGGITVNAKEQKDKKKYEAWIVNLDLNGDQLFKKVIKSNSDFLSLDDVQYLPQSNQYIITGTTEELIWVTLVDNNGNTIKEHTIGQDQCFSLLPHKVKSIIHNSNIYLYGTLKWRDGKRGEPFVAKINAQGELVEPGIVPFPDYQIEQVNSATILEQENKLILVGTTLDEGKTGKDIFLLSINNKLEKKSTTFISLLARADQDGVGVSALSLGGLCLIGSGITRAGADFSDIIVYQLDGVRELTKKDKPIVIGQGKKEESVGIIVKKDGSVWIGGNKDYGSKFYRNIDYYFKKLENKNELTIVDTNIHEGDISIRRAIISQTDKEEKKVHEDSKDYLQFIIENKSDQTLSNGYIKLECTNCLQGFTISPTIPLEDIPAKGVKKVSVPIWTESNVKEGDNTFNIQIKSNSGLSLAVVSETVYTYQRPTYQLVDYNFYPNRDSIYRDIKTILTVKFINTYFDTIEHGEVFFSVDNEFLVPYNDNKMLFSNSHPGDTLTISFPFRISSFSKADSLYLSGYVYAYERDKFYNFSVNGKIVDKREKDLVEIIDKIQPSIPLGEKIAENIVIEAKTLDEKIEPEEAKDIPNEKIAADNNQVENDNKKGMELEWDEDINLTTITKSVKEKFEIKIDVSSNFEPDINKFQIILNGSIISFKGVKADEINLKTRKRGTNKYRSPFTARISLVPGINKVQVLYADEDLKVQTFEELSIEYIPHDQGTLHVLSIGIPDKLGRLNYTKNDATDFAALFQKQEGSKLFQNVKITVLNTSETTTKLGIIKAISENLVLLGKRNALSKKDGIILFISSHGIRDDDQNFRILTSEHDDPDPSLLEYSSIDFENEIISKIKDLQCQKWVFIDACHSGTINAELKGVKGLNVGDISYAEELNKRLSASNKFRSITSCGAKEVSHEDDTWKNGAFTEGLCSLLSDKNLCRQLDTNGSHSLTLSEIYPTLRQTVDDMVKKVRKASQSPYYQIPEGEDVEFFSY